MAEPSGVTGTLGQTQPHTTAFAATSRRHELAVTQAPRGVDLLNATTRLFSVRDMLMRSTNANNINALHIEMLNASEDAAGWGNVDPSLQLVVPQRPPPFNAALQHSEDFFSPPGRSSNITNRENPQTFVLPGMPLQPEVASRQPLGPNVTMVYNRQINPVHGMDAGPPAAVTLHGFRPFHHWREDVVMGNSKFLVMSQCDEW